LPARNANSFRPANFAQTHVNKNTRASANRNPFRFSWFATNPRALAVWISRRFALHQSNSSARWMAIAQTANPRRAILSSPHANYSIPNQKSSTTLHALLLFWPCVAPPLTIIASVRAVPDGQIHR